MIRAVLFDFDGTLAHYTGDPRALAAHWLQRLNVPAGHQQALLEAYNRFERAEGSVTLVSALERAYAQCELVVPPDLPDLATQFVAEYVSHMQLLPHALETLQDFAGFPLGIVTNGPSDVQRAAIQALGIAPYFQVIVASGDEHVGLRKPAAKPFLVACQGLGVPPSETLMIGNSLEQDVRGARAAGLHAIFAPS